MDSKGSPRLTQANYARAGICFDLWEEILDILQGEVKNRDMIRLWTHMKIPISWGWNDDQRKRKLFISLECDQSYATELRELVEKLEAKDKK